MMAKEEESSKMLERRVKDDVITGVVSSKMQWLMCCYEAAGNSKTVAHRGDYIFSLSSVQ